MVDAPFTGRRWKPVSGRSIGNPKCAGNCLFVEATKKVTGSVQVKLYKGSATAISAKSPYSLYSESLATFGESASFDHKDSYGFVRLYGLPGMIAAQVARGKRSASAVKPAKPAPAAAKKSSSGKKRVLA